MSTQEIVSEAPSEFQISNLIQSLEKIDEEIKGNKAVLKHFKIDSDDLRKIKEQKKILDEAIKEEKERIENIYLEDEDYAEAVKSEKKLKNQRTEKIAELKSLLAKRHASNMQTHFKDELYTPNGQMVMHLEFKPVAYLNGKELK